MRTSFRSVDVPVRGRVVVKFTDPPNILNVPSKIRVALCLCLEKYFRVPEKIRKAEEIKMPLTPRERKGKIPSKRRAV